MRWGTECSTNKLNCGCHRLFLSHTPVSLSESGGCSNAFPGLALRCHGPSPSRMEGSEGKAECPGTSLPFYPISRAPASCRQKPVLPILGVALGMSFLGSGSSRKITFRAAVISATIIVMTLQCVRVPGSRSGLCVLLIYPSDSLTKWHHYDLHFIDEETGLG